MMRAAKKVVLSSSDGFADDADIVTRVQLKMIDFQKLGVAEMDIHLAGRSLDQEMSALGRR